jgi:hypothetical protein
MRPVGTRMLFECSRELLAIAPRVIGSRCRHQPRHPVPHCYVLQPVMCICIQLRMLAKICDKVTQVLRARLTAQIKLHPTSRSACCTSIRCIRAPLHAELTLGTQHMFTQSSAECLPLRWLSRKCQSQPFLGQGPRLSHSMGHRKVAFAGPRLSQRAVFADPLSVLELFDCMFGYRASYHRTACVPVHAPSMEQSTHPLRATCFLCNMQAHRSI